MFIDIYTHIFPGDFHRHMAKAGPRLGNIGEAILKVRAIHDLDERFRQMDPFDDYRQIISLPNPPLEDVTEPETGIELARIANDMMAELVARHPHRFPAFVAALALHDVEGSMEELHRAVGQLGAKGVQIFTNIAGKPLDRPEFQPVFDAMAAYDLPVWLHPARTNSMADYADEDVSRYEIWWCLGWPYETSVAMMRLVFSGIFDRLPNLKIVTHHMGGMIPYFDGRVGPGMAHLGTRTSTEDYSGVIPSLKKPHLDYFRQFYADTAMYGTHIGIKCGLEFFGADHAVFSTDAPFAPIGNVFEALDQIEMGPEERAAINFGNAGRLMNMDFG